MKGWQFRWFTLDPHSGLLEYYVVSNCRVYDVSLLLLNVALNLLKDLFCDKLYGNMPRLL